MKKKKIKLCLTKQLLNMFKLWCEWGIRLSLKQSYAVVFGARATTTLRLPVP